MTPPGRDVTRSQIRGSTLLLGGQAFAVAVNLVTQILIVRYLSKTSYGAFAFALSIVAIAETFAAFGLRRGVSRFVPIYEERRDLERAAGTLVFALGTVLGLGLAVVVTVAGLRGVIAGEVSGEPEAAAVLAILIVLAPINALESLLDGTFAVFARPRAIFVRRFVYTPVVRLVVVTLLVLSSSGVAFLAVGYVAAGALGVLAYSVLLVGVLRRHGLLALIRRRRLRLPVRELLGFTTPLLTDDLAGAVLASAGAILLGIMAGADDVAALRAVLPVSLTLTYVLSAFGTLFVPLASRLYARGEQAEVSRLYWQTAAWSAVFSFPVFALGVAFGEQLVTLLFGERYASSGAILGVLVAGHFVSAATGPNGTLLGVYGKVRYLVYTNLLAVAANLLLVIPLIAAFGALGAAIAGTATLVLLNGVRQLGLARRTPVRAIDRTYLPLYALLVAFTVLLLAVDLVLSPPLPVAIALVGVWWLAILVFMRTQLKITQTFPELARIPGIGRLIPTAGPRS